jgi:hypothetical protein
MGIYLITVADRGIGYADRQQPHLSLSHHQNIPDRDLDLRKSR